MPAGSTEIGARAPMILNCDEFPTWYVFVLAGRTYSVLAERKLGSRRSISNSDKSEGVHVSIGVRKVNNIYVSQSIFRTPIFDTPSDSLASEL